MEKFNPHMPENQRPNDNDYLDGLNKLFDRAQGAPTDKLRAFAKFVPLSSIGRFLGFYEIFTLIREVHGCIVECGVGLGGGTLSWATLSALLEPVNHLRRVVGFDTFTGFTAIDEKDYPQEKRDHIFEGNLTFDVYDEIVEAARLFDVYRPVGHIPKVELVKGNAVETIPRYVEDNPHFLVALLYLDFDLYNPTKVAIETFVKRMPKGAVIAFDELCVKQYPGETLALLDSLGMDRSAVRRFYFHPQLSYMVL